LTYVSKNEALRAYLIKKHIVPAQPVSFFIEGDFLLPVNCGSHSDYQTLLLKIFANIIRILMPFPVTLGILSIVFGISFFPTQMK
jgi:hypothetical protein